MKDFSERTDMGNGRSWTAEYKSWDWAHHGRFYFVISIYQEDTIINQIKVYVSDYSWRDSSCRYSDSDIFERIRSELHQLALNGESICDYV